MSFDYTALPREFSHRYVPPNVVISSRPEEVEKYFSELESRPLATAEGLERWLDDYSELMVKLSEEGTVRYIRMTEHTDNEGYTKDYLSYVESIEPRVKVGQFNISKRYIDSYLRPLLPPRRYEVMNRKIENSIRLFRPENVELEKEERKLAQRYQEIIGSLMTQFQGREQTMQQLARYQEEPDRALRESAWRAGTDRLLREESALDEIFDQMVAIRHRIALNAGFENFRDYAFVKRERFDYTPDDCYKFHEAVEQYVVPIVREVYGRRKETLAIPSLRYWDLAVDPAGRPPLRPYETTDQLVHRCKRIFSRLDRSFEQDFGRMIQLGLLDLESRKGKAPGGYNAELMDARLPFIFMNSVGRDIDLKVLLHESGHAFHVFEMRQRDLHYLYRSESMPTEFSEVASMSMELLGLENIQDTFYPVEEDVLRSRYEHFLAIAKLLAWIATIDAFQDWIYTHPGHDREERRREWSRIHARFDSGEDWQGLERERGSFWHRQLHIFEQPFYYIEYGIAQLGALGVWSSYLKDRQATVSSYRFALSLGGSKPLPDLFEAAGLPWEFGPRIVSSFSGSLRRILLP